MIWLLAYLLVGFVISWVGSNVLSAKPNPAGWAWELAAVLLWPVTILIVIFSKGRAAE